MWGFGVAASPPHQTPTLQQQVWRSSYKNLCKMNVSQNRFLKRKVSYHGGKQLIPF